MIIQVTLKKRSLSGKNTQFALNSSKINSKRFYLKDRCLYWLCCFRGSMACFDVLFFVLRSRSFLQSSKIIKIAFLWLFGVGAGNPLRGGSLARLRRPHATPFRKLHGFATSCSGWLSRASSVRSVLVVLSVPLASSRNAFTPRPAAPSLLWLVLLRPYVTRSKD